MKCVPICFILNYWDILLKQYILQIRLSFPQAFKFII